MPVFGAGGPVAGPAGTAAVANWPRGRMLSRGGSKPSGDRGPPPEQRQPQGSQSSSVLARREQAPFQRHQRLLGWKLTSLERRREMIQLLEGALRDRDSVRSHRPGSTVDSMRSLVVGFGLELEDSPTASDLLGSASSSLRSNEGPMTRSSSR